MSATVIAVDFAARRRAAYPCLGGCGAQLPKRGICRACEGLIAHARVSR